MTCWILVEEGLIGTLNQCLGIVSYLNIAYEVKEIKIRWPWSFCSPFLRIATEYSFTQDSADLSPPYPDLIIAAGRKAVAPALWLKKQSKGKSFVVQVLDPRISAKHFDLVIAPEHDPIEGKNVIKTIGAPNLITQEKLIEEKGKFDELEKLNTPKIAVLVGGSSKAFSFDDAQAQNLGKILKELAEQRNASLMVTTSRRTGETQTNTLKSALKGTNSVIWDGKTPNPYFAYLAWADYIIVTSDSASMISEAASTGKPTYIFELKGGAKRIDAFKRNIVNGGYAKILQSSEPESFKPKTLNDARIAAEAILKNM